ncbi:hypothetical protein [Planococcus sp. YIM B11945]|uniref:hypothetical protein n=1 Tax=Planococcus sp. YIM B11945 TaxID=3435410 RepID=UPI003D7D70FE
MTTTNVHCEITAFSASDDGHHMAEDYAFWPPLIAYFIDRSDAFEIHCWEEEQETVEQIQRELDQVQLQKEGHTAVFSGPLTPETKAFFPTKALNNKNQLKWFSVFLLKDGQSLFSSEHYGTELIGYGLTDEQTKFLQEALPENASFTKY